MGNAGQSWQIAVVVLVMLAVSTAGAKYGGGMGEPNDPYRIATAADLIALGETPEDYDKHFILTADLDLDPNLPGRKVFERAVIAPDGNSAEEGFQGTPFTGVFDGNGHTVSHLTIIGVDYLGLFGELGDVPSAADVGNLRIVDANVAGSGSYIGGLAGFSRGDVAMCYSTGKIQGDLRVGGLIGRNWGSVTACGCAASVTAEEDAGGLVANNYGDVIDCYSTGAVTANRDAGGLVGENYGNITASYSVGAVVGVTRAGGLVGYNWTEARVSDSFWNVETSRVPTSEGGIATTTALMKTARTFLDAGWDFVGETDNGTENVWWILEGKGYPRLWWQLPADDFEDGKAEPLWTVYEVDPELVQIREVNGRLETAASAQAQNVDAFYAADGWGLDSTKDFAIRIDFHFGKHGGGDGRVTLGVAPSLDPAAMKWAEFEAGCFNSGPFYLYEVSDGFWRQEEVVDRSSDEGTLYMSYNPDADELYFSHTGYGKANAWQTVRGLLKGRWGSGPVYVILGGGSEGLAFTGTDAWLDNFAVEAGAILK